MLYLNVNLNLSFKLDLNFIVHSRVSDKLIIILYKIPQFLNDELKIRILTKTKI